MYANKEKTKASFNLVKEHIFELQTQIQELNNEFQKLKNQNGKEQSNQFVGAVNGNSLHIESCPFAKKIQPKNKTTFTSVEKARNNGYKPCECMKQF